MKKNYYTYCIINLVNGKKYIGSRETILNPSDDLGKLYFSSSSDKEFIIDQKEKPSNYKYDIFKTFTSREDADIHESNLHNEYEVDKNPIFYNRSRQTINKFRYDPTGTKLSRETKAKISESLKGRLVSKETRQKLRNANLGKKLTGTCKLKLSVAHIGMLHSEETKKKMSTSRKKRIGNFAPSFGMKHKRKECPYCNKDVSINVYSRFHNDNCKQKNSIV